MADGLQPRRVPSTPSRLAALFGRSPSEPGTARLGKAIAQFSPQAALAALGPTVESHFRSNAEALAYSLAIAPEKVAGAIRYERDRATRYADAASLLSKSSDVRADVLAFARLLRWDAFTDTAAVVVAWVDAGRPARTLCPECNSETTHIDAEPEDANCGLGAIDAGPVCVNCEWDGRVLHKPTSRGNDAPFLG
jgi:hypothetical protein